MAGIMYGYARVSTQVQNEARQLAALRDFGVAEENIIIEKQSGKDFNRPRYKRLVRKLHTGDVLVTQSIDRLGRNYSEILEQWRILTREKKVDIAVLDMPLLDTRRGKDLLGTLIADLVLSLLSYVSENERCAIRQRQKEGIEAARLKGVRFGRPQKVLPENFEQICVLWQSGELSSRKAAKLCGMPLTSFCRIGEEWKGEQREMA